MRTKGGTTELQSRREAQWTPGMGDPMHVRNRRIDATVPLASPPRPTELRKRRQHHARPPCDLVLATRRQPRATPLDCPIPSLHYYLQIYNSQRKRSPDEVESEKHTNRKVSKVK
ncbi:hypothetical protein ECG_05425 [Echinococcus granulosus]|nr:hypothetical protein ECG_05425 [Echinococcus granulosus]